MIGINLKKLSKIALITPPFTQLSSPYPAMPFLAGFLKIQGFENSQIDLGLETALSLFSRKGLTSLFKEIETKQVKKTGTIPKFIKDKDRYIDTIDNVINFIQGKNRALYHRIVTREFLPENKRFDILKYYDILDQSSEDHALFLSTLYIDDISDLAKKTVLPFFGLSSYGERLDKSITDFNIIEKQIKNPDLITKFIFNNLSSYDFSTTRLAAITIPFPGNLLASLKIAKWLKKKYPDTRIAAGGGYVNTELCSLSDTSIFRYFDYICFGDGEIPLVKLAEHTIYGGASQLVRTMVFTDGRIDYINSIEKKSYPVSVPDYHSLDLDRYMPLKETANVMHNLWSEKGFLKLRFARGCYHHKCTFCDTGLDYIKDFVPLPVEKLIGQITVIINQTGVNSFHFTDEAMPPAMIKLFCLELIKRKINIIWWGNIRFEKQFDASLCSLMSRAGCIAVTGGIETANNRILDLMEKGMHIEQIIRTCNYFSESKILVHGYLIYGFPTETANEAANSLEIIRQMFFHNILNSAYYHRFTLTVHSPVFADPEKYGIKIKRWKPNSFANNDVDYDESNKRDIDGMEAGLNKAVFNFNSGNCLEDDVNSWFDNAQEIHVSENFVFDILNG